MSLRGTGLHISSYKGMQGTMHITTKENFMKA